MRSIVPQSPLCLGETLQVHLDQDDVFEETWTDVTVKDFAVCFHPRVTDELAPYVLVQVDHPQLTCFNFSLYASTGHVRRKTAKGT